MIDLVDVMVQRLARFPYIRSPYRATTQPFIMYLDSRFCSIEALQLINKADMLMVGSNSVSRRPTKLWPYLKEDLEKREWRTVYWSKEKAVVCVVRAKKRAYVNLVSNNVGDHTHVIIHAESTPAQATRWPLLKCRRSTTCTRIMLTCSTR